MVHPDAGRVSDNVSMRVLLVDDDRPAAHAVTELIKKQGYNVASSFRAEAASAIVESFNPDLVVLNVRTPEWDALELARNIRGIPLNQEPVLVAYSNGFTKSILNDCATAGFDHVLLEPFEVAEFKQLTDLVRITAGQQSQFDRLTAQFEAQVFTFMSAQLEFCHLVLDAMRFKSSQADRQRQIVRLYRTITLAEIWLIRQHDLTSEKAIVLERNIAALRSRLADSSMRAFE